MTPDREHTLEEAARTHEKEARRYEASAQESDGREDNPSMTEGDCARFIAETHRSAAATLRALASPAQEPAPSADAEEWQLVPKEPTLEMLNVTLPQPIAVKGTTVETIRWHLWRAMLVAAPALRRYAGDAWRPIETAPDDGRKILLYSPLKSAPYIVIGRNGEWIASYAWQHIPDPTHWMPLPAPPAARAKSSEKGGAL